MTNENIIEQLSKAFLDIEDDVGTTRLTELTFEAIESSMNTLRSNNLDDFINEFRDFLENIKSTKPRIWIIIYYISLLWDAIEWKLKTYKTIEEFKTEIRYDILKFRNELQIDTQKMISYWVAEIKDWDSILIHDQSWTILSTLHEACSKWIKFKVVLAEQAKERSLNTILFLQNEKIPFVVVPEFMLTNIEKEITKVFVWWITLNNEFSFIWSAWNWAIVSELFHAWKKIYIFMVTKKFSLWESEAKKDMTYTKIQKKTSIDPRIKSYDTIKFSHDRIDINMFNWWIITEVWTLNIQETKNLYNKLYEEKKYWRKKFFENKKI